MPKKKPGPSRGRPRQLTEAERRLRLIDAAEDVFLAAGYADASMDDVAQRAAMSKKTLYQIFATKEALFAAMIAERTDKLITAIKAEAGERAPREVLETFLGRVAHFCLAPRQLAMHRLVVAESMRSPELARAFMSAGAGRAKPALAQWLPLQRSLGAVTAKDSEEVGGMLVGMIVGEMCMKLLFGIGRPPSKREIDRRVKRAVDIFLNGYRGSPRSA